MRLDHLLSMENRRMKNSSEFEVKITESRQCCLILRVLKRKLKSCTENSKRIDSVAWHGGIAQLGEHLLCKQGVNGSIPFISTTGLGIEP